jgi:hypothetical protein
MVRSIEILPSDDAFTRIYKTRFARMGDHLPESTDLCLLTLKGHLLAEEMLEEIIRHYCASPQELDGVEIGFYVKVRLAKSLVGTIGPNYVWAMADALNALRNELSHKLEGMKVEAKIERFIAICIEHGMSAQRVSPPTDLWRTLAYFLGCLSSVEAYVRGGAPTTLGSSAE